MNPDIELLKNSKKIYTDEGYKELLFGIKETIGFECKKCKTKTYYVKKSKAYSRMCTKCKTIESLTSNTALHKTKLPLSVALKIIIDLQRRHDKVINRFIELVTVRVSLLSLLNTKILTACTDPHIGLIRTYFG